MGGTMRDKLKVTAFVSLAFLLLCVPGAVRGSGDDNNTGGGEASCHVYVDVIPNVAVMAMQPVVDLGSIQTGVFSGTIPFRVDANTERVRIWGAVTKLYKGDLGGPPDSLDVEPIKIQFLSTLGIYPHNGNPVGGEDNEAVYYTLFFVDGLQGYMAQPIVFESAQNGHFSQQVDLVARWEQADPEKPMGEYSGKVRIFTEVVLPPY
jgi:hypothetical protein